VVTGPYVLPRRGGISANSWQASREESCELLQTLGNDRVYGILDKRPFVKEGKEVSRDLPSGGKGGDVASRVRAVRLKGHFQ